MKGTTRNPGVVSRMFLPLAQGAADDYNAAQRPKIMEAINFSHHFLIAMPGMVDPNFAKSLTYKIGRAHV